jgi:hypothetical protein
MSKIDELSAINPQAAANLIELAGDRYVQDAEAEADYVLHVIKALRSGAFLILWLTPRCPECGDVPRPDEDVVHVVHVGHVVIGCEGYRVINPNSVGVQSENWDDWTEHR